MRKRNNTAYKRIWGDEPLGFISTCEQCHDCVMQFFNQGKISDRDWAKGICRIYTEENDGHKPFKIMLGEEKCPHKISIKQALEIFDKLKQ